MTEPQPAHAEDPTAAVREVAPPPRRGLLTRPLGIGLAAATVLTLAGAALSAYAVSSEPTLRAEDSAYVIRPSVALRVQREVALDDRRPVTLGVDRGATHRDDYAERARELARSL